MARRTRSHGIVNSVPGAGSGRRRPDASGAPGCIRMNSTPVTLPVVSSVMTRIGPAWKIAVTPSSMASWTSSAAGMSFMSRRYTSVTSPAPWRTDVREQSIDVNPPPMTTTRLPAWSGYGRPSVAVRRYSRPSMTPSASSLGMPSLFVS